MQYAIVGGFIILDIMSGTLSSLKNKNWTSTKMREGLFHKMAIIILIAVASLCDFGQTYLNIGFEVPVTKGVLIYVCFMEIGSVVENLIKICPQLKTILLKTFQRGINDAD